MAQRRMPAAGLSKCQAIPSVTDRNFHSRIRARIESEIGKLGYTEQGVNGHRYIIYKNAFDKMIENTTAYKNILTAIKQEYDESINVLLEGQKDSLLLQRKLKSMASEPATLMAYKNRAMQLQKKIEIIKKNTAGLETSLQVTKNSRNVKDETTEETLLPEKETSNFKLIPGLTLEESVNVEDLCKHLQKLERKLKDLRVNKETKYVPIQIKTKISEKINQKMQQCEELVVANEQLTLRYTKLKMIADAVTAWGHSDKSVSLTEFIWPSMTKARSLKEVDVPWPGVFDDDDPSNIDEAAYLLEYVERFTKLFEEKQYQAAAMYVANCPRGILHNMEVMEKFKAVTEYEGYVSPLLHFFEAVMNSFSAVRHPPNAKMSLEGVKCALMHNRQDLVIRWVIQQRLGEISGALAHIHESKKLSLDDCLFLLSNCQNTELLQGLTHEWNGNPAALSIGLAVLWLISNDLKEVGFHLLKETDDCGQGALEQAILNDAVSTLEDWQEIAEECNTHNYSKLANSIFAVLTSQEGGTVITITTDDDKDGAKLTEHVLL
ncbi:clathrin heavy chain linker domain-containing protein 1-like isoform X2 [Mobula birostris]|uniref:clathrin heavy chain linker domain-containing protein 1-like isoform X2 n=1 Tax=Mobula birostris TaxID=1983395 RepID=UPI003B27DA3F